MKLRFYWTENNREERFTEMDIPTDKNWEEVKEHTISALKKAIKYSNEPLPEGITISEL